MVQFVKLIGRTVSLSILVIVFISIVGCSNERPVSVAATSSSLQRLAIYMGKYISSNRGALPKNEAELKAFIKSQAPSEPDFDKLFVSERDGKPFVVAYANSKSPFFAYEQVGSDGSRYVVMPTTEVKLLEEAEFQSALKK